MKKSRPFVRALIAATASVLFVTAEAGVVVADENAPAAQPSAGQLSFPTAEPINLGASTVRMLGGFLLCLGIFGAGIHVYRKYAGTAMLTGKRRLRLVERLPVSSKSSVLLISLDGKELLVATGPDNLRLLAGDGSKQRYFEGSLADACAMQIEDETCAM